MKEPVAAVITVQILKVVSQARPITHICCECMGFIAIGVNQPI